MADLLLEKDKVFFGFRVLSLKNLPEYRSIGIRLVHESTGAEVYHLQNEDKENLFSFNFRTPPQDNAGVPHILEHWSLVNGCVRR